ncbi:MAG: beta-ketoacyl-ACP synthase III [Parachlamydiales bacterium]|jgi:3-oxoacyl-[acyl-carrier-protein] synthase-3
MPKKAKIIATGSYLPKKVLTNADLEKMVQTSDEWIVTRTGIRERRLAAADEYTSEMGFKAAEKALDAAGLKPEEIDLILVATLTPDYIFPSTACLIQDKLKAKNAAALDIQAACSGYLYGLLLAKSLVENGSLRRVLLIASEKLSSIVNYQDRSTCVLFGDGAAAAVIALQGPGFEIEAVCLGSDGSCGELLKLPAGGSRCPASLETVKNQQHYLQMAGGELFKHAVRRMETASKACLKILKMQEKEVDWLIPHQANLRIIEAVGKRFEHLPQERVYKEGVAKYGNTSACSVGIALDELSCQGKIQNQEHLLLTAFGAGLTWGAALLTKKSK